MAGLIRCNEAVSKTMPDLFLRIDLGGSRLLGPGKVRLLELIDRLGSISAAGRAMGMSYRRAWLLVAELNDLFRQSVVDPRHGGRSGGGAAVTPFGHEVIRRYRAIEAEAHAAAAEHLDALQAAAAPPAETPPRTAPGGRPADCAGGTGRDAGPAGTAAGPVGCRRPSRQYP